MFGRDATIDNAPVGSASAVAVAVMSSAAAASSAASASAIACILRPHGWGPHNCTTCGRAVGSGGMARMDVALPPTCTKCASETDMTKAGLQQCTLCNSIVRSGCDVRRTSCALCGGQHNVSFAAPVALQLSCPCGTETPSVCAHHTMAPYSVLHACPMCHAVECATHAARCNEPGCYAHVCANRTHGDAHGRALTCTSCAMPRLDAVLQTTPFPHAVASLLLAYATPAVRPRLVPAPAGPHAHQFPTDDLSRADAWVRAVTSTPDAVGFARQWAQFVHPAPPQLPATPAATSLADLARPPSPPPTIPTRLALYLPPRPPTPEFQPLPPLATPPTFDLAAAAAAAAAAAPAVMAARARPSHTHSDRPGRRRVVILRAPAEAAAKRRASAAATAAAAAVAQDTKVAPAAKTHSLEQEYAACLDPAIGPPAADPPNVLATAAHLDLEMCGCGAPLFLDSPRCVSVDFNSPTFGCCGRLVCRACAGPVSEHRPARCRACRLSRGSAHACDACDLLVETWDGDDAGGCELCRREHGGMGAPLRPVRICQVRSARAPHAACDVAVGRPRCAHHALVRADVADQPCDTCHVDICATHRLACAICLAPRCTRCVPESVAGAHVCRRCQDASAPETATATATATLTATVADTATGTTVADAATTATATVADPATAAATATTTATDVAACTTDASLPN